MSDASLEPSPKPKRKPRTKAQRSPVEARNLADPGDATQRNFRYQHCYGVMLLVGAKLGLRPYIAIWCEQHEDFLAERDDKKFDGFAIKTSRPERGAWRLDDKDLVRVIGRFSDLVDAYGEQIGSLYFVSNTECEAVGPDNANELLRARCPGHLLAHVQDCENPADISGAYRDVFGDLQAKCGCSETLLFTVLRRIHLVLGPSRNEMDAVLSHEHLAKIEPCKSLAADKLNQIRDDLVARVYRASSLQLDDPIRHLRPVFSQSEMDPALAAKRIGVVDTDIAALAMGDPPAFQFVGDVQVKLGEPGGGDVLKQKLEAGGLLSELDYMQERERSAERHLLEDVARRPERYPQLMKQIEHVVLGECREAHLRARQGTAPYGPTMMIDVQNRLRRIAREETTLIGGQSYECLVGMAGLLTSECVVWWSPRFSIKSTEGK